MSIEIDLLYVLSLPVITFSSGLLIGINKKKKIEKQVLKLENEILWEHSVILKLERELAGVEAKKAAV